MKYFLLDNGCRGIFLEFQSSDFDKNLDINDENSDNNNENINEESEENSKKQKLSEESIQFVIEKIMDFINLKYSIHKWDEIESVCKAVTFILPCIEMVRNKRLNFR